MEDNTAISFANVAARYDGTPEILTDVSFNISNGAFYFLSGASGAGKTTLLRLIYQLHRPSRGQIKLFGNKTNDMTRDEITKIRQKMAIVAHGKKATTHYERIAVFGKGVASHIQCILETGRTHQIRVHMSSIGHSLIGDPIYGNIPRTAPDFAKYFPRQALHAGFLGFTHPRTGERLSFEAPLPDDMQELLERLEELE